MGMTASFAAYGSQAACPAGEVRNVDGFCEKKL